MVISPTTPPPIGGLGGTIDSWQRGKDPWHVDAFPDEFKDQATHRRERAEGWYGLDWCGNVIAFVADGTEID